MQNEKKNRSKKRYWIMGGVVFAILLLAVLTVAYYDAVSSGIFFVLGLFRTVFIGLSLAYLCNPFFRFFETKLFSGIRHKGFRRTLSLVLTYLLLLVTLAALVLLVIPGLIQSFGNFMANYEAHLDDALTQCNNLIDRINGLIGSVSGDDRFLDKLDAEKLSEIFAQLFRGGENAAPLISWESIWGVVGGVGSAFSLVTDSVLGVFVSLYILIDKEKLHAKLLKVRAALFSDKVNAVITRICKTADRCFGRFVGGKLLDSLLVGILVYVALLITDVPYAILLAAIIAVCNIIPIIGPLVGAVPCGVIVVLTAPSKIFIFILIALLIQQLDSNIFAPKILGSNIGISSLCVVIAFTTMTALWGLWGAILGVPLFATVLELLDHYTVNRLKKKGLPSGVESYYAQGAVVDYGDDAKTSTRRLKRKMEDAVLSAQRTLDEKGEKALTRKERIHLNVYQWAKKHRLAEIITDSTYMKSGIEAATHDAYRASDALMDAEAEANDDATCGEKGDADGSR